MEPNSDDDTRTVRSFRMFLENEEDQQQQASSQRPPADSNQDINSRIQSRIQAGHPQPRIANNIAPTQRIKERIRAHTLSQSSTARSNNRVIHPLIPPPEDSVLGASNISKDEEPLSARLRKFREASKFGRFKLTARAAAQNPRTTSNRLKQVQEDQKLRKEILDLELPAPPDSTAFPSFPATQHRHIKYVPSVNYGNLTDGNLETQSASDSIKFTIEADSSRNGSISGKGTTDGLMQAINSQYVPAPKRRKDKISALSDESIQVGENNAPSVISNDSNGYQVNAGVPRNHQPPSNIENSENEQLLMEDPPSALMNSSVASSISLNSDILPPSRVRTHSGGDQANDSLSEIVDEYGRRRPRDPHEIDTPLVFEIAVDEMPAIDWAEEDVDVDGQFLEQQLEHSESESEEESDLGSVADMIDNSGSDSDSESIVDDNREWIPRDSDEAIQQLSDSGSDFDGVEALTESDSEYGGVDADLPAIDDQLAVGQARSQRRQRARIPTVKFWLGERVEYSTNALTGLMTAKDVRKVQPAVKTYRKRRRTKLRPPTRSLLDDMEMEDQQHDVHARVYDSQTQQWKNRTVAKSIGGHKYTPVKDVNGAPIALVYRSVTFGSKGDSGLLRNYMLKIGVGGIFSHVSEQNKACTFVVWKGKCTVTLNDHQFDLTKGMACSVPRGNDLHVDNGSADGVSPGDVYLFVTEINAEVHPDMADEMARDPQSMISGAFSNIFYDDDDDDDNNNSNNDNDNGWSDNTPEIVGHGDADSPPVEDLPIDHVASDLSSNRNGVGSDIYEKDQEPYEPYTEPIADIGSKPNGARNGETDSFVSSFARALDSERGTAAAHTHRLHSIRSGSKTSVMARIAAKVHEIRTQNELRETDKLKDIARIRGTNPTSVENESFRAYLDHETNSSQHKLNFEIRGKINPQGQPRESAMKTTGALLANTDGDSLEEYLNRDLLILPKIDLAEFRKHFLKGANSNYQ